MTSIGWTKSAFDDSMGRGDEMNGTRDYLRELLTILFIQKRLIAAVTLLFLTGAILIAFLWPPSYASSGSIFIKNNRTIKTPEELENVNWEVTTVQETDLYSEIGILTSEELIKKTVERLAQEEGLFPDQVKDPLSLQRLIRRIQKSMSAELLPRSTIFKVTLVWHDPARAQKLLTALMEDYLLFRGQIHSPPKHFPSSRSSWLTSTTSWCATKKSCSVSPRPFKPWTPPSRSRPTWTTSRTFKPRWPRSAARSRPSEES